MKHYTYLIIGGGMTADAAVKGIRDLDPKGSIAVIGKEPHPPYARPPLSKKLWMGKPEEIIWRGTDAFTVDLLTGRRAVSLDPDAATVHDDRGETYRYDRLLIATGGTPRRLSLGGDDVIYFRTLDDYRRLRTLADAKGRIAVIGGGFIGSEIAAALATNGCDVSLVFPEDTICSRVFPPDLAQFVTGYYRDRGIETHAGESVAEIRRQGDRHLLVTASGRAIEAYGVVAGLGIVPDLELAVQAGLPTGNGIVVDELLRAGRPEIFAAGDVANFYSPLLDTRMRVEHEDNALVMGRQAGRNMAGAGEPYRHLPFFYSDLFDLGYEAVGELDSRLETMADWQEPFRKGVVYYLRDGRVRGVLLWNVWDQVDHARSLIGEPGPFRPEDLRGRLPA